VDRMDAEGFVEAAIQLYSNQELWYRAQKKGTVCLNSNYSKKKLLPQLRQKLETIARNLSGHRERNYIGILLQHQSLAATKYMGKWIEAKNKD
ncbi:MAG: glycosyltransferase, partial [Bacteroidota bacterium]